MFWIFRQLKLPGSNSYRRNLSSRLGEIVFITQMVCWFVCFLYQTCFKSVLSVIWICKTSLPNYKLKSSPAVLLPSKILGLNSKYQAALRMWLEPFLPKNARWHSCYIASKHGFAAQTFHEKCYAHGATVTLVKVGKFVFGGFSDQRWAGRNFSYRVQTSVDKD